MIRPTILTDNRDVSRKLIDTIRHICYTEEDFGRVLYETVPEFEHCEGPNNEWIYLKPVNDGVYSYAIPDWGC